MKSCIFLMPGRLYTSSGSPLPRAQATNAFIASAPRYRSPSGAMAQALALHSSRVSPTEAGVPLFWKGTAVTRRLRSSVLSRRTDRVQNPQAPSNTRVRCCGRSVKVTNQIVPLPSGWRGTGATRMAELRRMPPYLYVCRFQVHILGDAQGDRGWLENASLLKMAVEESPLGS